MEPQWDNSAILGLREWLRSERRLGIRHWACIPASKSASASDSAGQAVAPPRAQQPPATDRGRPPIAPPRRPTERALPGIGAGPAGDDGLPLLCAQELSEAAAREALADLDARFVRNCRKCRLHTGRTQTVFGAGRARPEIAFVGEGPGADEDAQGVPFVGRAGELLTRMITGMTLTRNQVYIANIVKCRPPNNRTPSDDEMEACSPYLVRQLAILRPRVIVALGRPASQTLLQVKTPISRLRGDFYDFPPPGSDFADLPPTKLMPTFHPAYLLRSPGEKSKVWEDLKQVMRYLSIPIPPRYA